MTFKKKCHGLNFDFHEIRVSSKTQFIRSNRLFRFFHVPTFNIHEHSIEEDKSYDTVSRCFHYAMLERGPVQLNIPRDMYYGDLVTTIPEPMKVDRSAGKYIYLEICTILNSIK